MNTLLQQAIDYNPSDKRNNIIRRLAYYLYLDMPKIEMKKYYDDPSYPNWHGGFIKTGLKDFRNRTYGIVLSRIDHDDKLRAKLLKQARSIYMNEINNIHLF